MLCFVFVVIKELFNLIAGVVHNAFRKIVVSKNCIALFVNNSSLLIQNIIIIKQVLTNLKVAVFYLLLSLFNTLVEPWMVNRFSRLHTDSAHHSLHSFATKETHQIIIHRDVEFRASRVTLTSRTSAQLIIDTA